MVVHHRRDARSALSWAVALAPRRALSRAIARRHCHCCSQLAGRPRAAHGRSSGKVVRPDADRLHVVPGLALEAAVLYDGKRPLLLDEANDRELGLRLAPRSRRACFDSGLHHSRSDRLFGGAHVCGLADPRPRGTPDRTFRHPLRAKSLDRPLSTSRRMAMELCVPRLSDGRIQLASDGALAWARRGHPPPHGFDKRVARPRATSHRARDLAIRAATGLRLALRSSTTKHNFIAIPELR